MPFHDLNVAYTPDHTTLQHTLSFAGELGYDTVALSISIGAKIPNQLPDIPVSTLSTGTKVKILTRTTLTISDTSQNHRLSTLQAKYDIVALRVVTLERTDEKLFQLACLSFECDLISLDLTQRIPFPIKFKTVASALQRGVRFEICYAAGIKGSSEARRNLISNATSLIRATRGRGIVISSEAKVALGLRAPADVINLAQVWGLSQERGKEAVCEEAGKVVRLAAFKRTSFKGVVDVIGNEVGEASHQASQKLAQQGPGPTTLARSTQDGSPATDIVTGANGPKRKASASSLGATPERQTRPETLHAHDPPVSTHEQVKRARKIMREAGNRSDASLEAGSMFDGDRSTTAKDQQQQQPPPPRGEARPAHSVPVLHETVLPKSVSSSAGVAAATGPSSSKSRNKRNKKSKH